MRIFNLYIIGLLCFTAPCISKSSNKLKTNSLSPANKAVNVNPDTRLKIIFHSEPVPGDSGKIRIYDASNDHLVDSLDMSLPPGPIEPNRERAPYTPVPYEYIPGHFTNANTRPGTPSGTALPTPDNYQLTIIGGFTDGFHFYPVIVHDTVATIALHHNLLEYNKSYYVRIDPGVLRLKDGSFNGTTGKTDWIFSTRKAPPPSDSKQFVIAGDGSGDFNTVQGAVDFIPDHNPERTTLFIKNGIYEEIVCFRNKTNITFLGEDRDKVIVCYANNEVFNPHPANISTNEWPGTFPSRRAVFMGDNCRGIHLVNFTIRSINDKPAQAEGLLLMGSENIVCNMDIFGSGDALQMNGSVYLENSKITGFGDNVLGRGPAFFKNCELVSMYGPHMWIRNTEANHGNVFLNCTFRMTGTGQTTIARTNDNRSNGYPFAEAVLLNCVLDGICPEGWCIKGSGTSNIHYWEFNSVNLGDGKPVDVSRRHPLSKQLTLQEHAKIIADYSDPAYVLGGWTPAMAPVILSQPESVHVRKGGTAEFRIKAAGVPESDIQWLKNGNQIKGANKSVFVIKKKSSDVYLYIDKYSDELVKWAANDLAADINKMVGKKITIKYTETFNPDTRGIYIGEMDDRLIKNLPENHKTRLQDKWENFIIKNYHDNLFIVGSDIRGTVFGIFEVAERLGISPWKWWADVTPLKKGSMTLDLPPEGIEAGPSVQYRGIFLNDEDWGLQPWAANTFEPETKDIGPKTYEKIFQLLLRLKANTIWPAMHPCTRAFFSIPGNKEMAEKYHIYIGTSHAEPMLRNNVDEWNEQEYGEYNFFQNSIRVKQYWQKRITEAKNGNNIITMGMRGIHDSGMEGNASQEDKIKMLETIIKEQREILTKTLGKSIENIPQVFIPYKEVLSLYNEGLKIPDDITLMWTDDNYGYIRRLGNKTEQLRKGGSGVYYHISYWGRPHDYLWLSSTQPGLIWYEMSRAYQNGSKKIWIVNVGDIKPAEYNMEFFLDLAWDINCINETTIKKHLHNWCIREFGKNKAKEITDVLEEYYRLAFLRKPEYMGWSRTEPTTSTKMTEFGMNNNNELQRRIDSYLTLFENVKQIKLSIPAERQDAYFQLVAYPVKCAALMNFKFLYAQQAYLLEDKKQKTILRKKSRQAYNDIKTLTAEYNNKISGGKWQKMMSMDPRNLPAYAMPVYHLSDSSMAKNKPAAQTRQLTPIFIQADDFSKASNYENYKWKTIEGLGYSHSSVTLFPLDNHRFDNETPFLEYRFEIEKTGKYEIEIRCLPTHSNNFDSKIWIEMNNHVFEPCSINTRGRSETWKINVLRNFVQIIYPVTFEKTGMQILKVYVNQTGIVLDQIAVNPDGYGKYYEIVKPEKPEN